MTLTGPAVSSADAAEVAPRPTTADGHLRRSELEPPRLRYIRGLDGLRAVAVAAVLVYHLSPGLLPGGFLGVSLFFTLSGFLITNLLVAEWQGSSRIRLRTFWGRRFRRLLPAALVTLLLAVAVAAVTADAAQLRNLRGDVMAALLYVANWRFVLNGNHYGMGYEQPSVVLHFWSLAIEEQFYVLVALVTGLLARVTRHRQTWFVVFAGLALASMAATIALYTPGDTERIYFGSATRAFELLAGVLLALVVGQRAPSWLDNRVLRAVLGVAALVAFAVLTRTTHTFDAWLYRGGFWLVAGISCTLILVCLAGGGVTPALCWRPVVALGLVSYGVYLYHWPLLLLLSPERTGLDGLALAALRVAATLALAIPSYFFLERPIRRGRVRLRSVVVVLVVAVVAVILLLTTTLLGRDAGDRAVAADAPDVALRAPVTALPPPSSVAPAAVPTLERVLFVGDSLVHQAWPTIEDRLASAGIEAHIAGGPGQNLLSNGPAWLSELQTLLDQFRPQIVVLQSCCLTGDTWSAAPDAPTVLPDTPEQDAAWARAASLATEVAEAGGARVVWILAPPAQTNGYYGPIEDRIPRSNAVYQQVVACHAGTGLVDWGVIAAPDGSFTPTLPDASGNPVRVRHEDGLHFTPEGQALLADFTRSTLETFWHQVGGPAATPATTPPRGSCPG